MRIAGFGTFRTRSRAARTGRNPRSGESVAIPASKSPSFKAAKALRDAVKRGWPPEEAEPVDDRHGRPGSAGAMLEMSDWPGGVEPVWTLLEPESIRALRAEPSADNGTLRLGAELPDEAFGDSAFVRNALIVLHEPDAPACSCRDACPSHRSRATPAHRSEPGSSPLQNRDHTRHRDVLGWWAQRPRTGLGAWCRPNDNRHVPAPPSGALRRAKEAPPRPDRPVAPRGALFLRR